MEARKALLLQNKAKSKSLSPHCDASAATGCPKSFGDAANCLAAA